MKNLFAGLGVLFLVLAVADFASGWMGYNFTYFLGPLSSFTPLILGAIGAGLIKLGSGNINNDEN